MANSYTFNQIATILNQIVQEAQGRAANDEHVPVDTSEFVSVANTAIQTVGLDPIMNSVTQMINRTVFAFRPYNRKFKILENDDIAYGNQVRKITPIFVDSAEDQPMYDSQPADGYGSDHYKIKRPKALQTVFAGAEQYMIQAPTVFEDQLRTAFKGPGELARFLEIQTGEVQNEIEQQAESLARNTIANFIGGIAANGIVDQNIHLLTLYNNQTGLSLTSSTVYQPENFGPFIRWMYALMNRVSDMMTNRSVKFHAGITGNVILRHTPKEDQRLLIYSPIMRQIETMVLSTTYHDDLLRMAKHETVDFWQDFEFPDRIDVTPSMIADNGDGTVVTGETQNLTNVVAVLYDKDAMGTNLFMERAAASPMNAVGLYFSVFHHFAKRYWNDFTENGIIFTLD